MLRVVNTGVSKEHTDNVRSERHIVAIIRDPIQRHACNAADKAATLTIRVTQKPRRKMTYALLNKTWS